MVWKLLLPFINFEGKLRLSFFAQGGTTSTDRHLPSWTGQILPAGYYLLCWADKWLVNLGVADLPKTRYSTFPKIPCDGQNSQVRLVLVLLMKPLWNVHIYVTLCYLEPGLWRHAICSSEPWAERIDQGRGGRRHGRVTKPPAEPSRWKVPTEPYFFLKSRTFLMALSRVTVFKHKHIVDFGTFSWMAESQCMVKCASRFFMIHRSILAFLLQFAVSWSGCCWI